LGVDEEMMPGHRRCPIEQGQCETEVFHFLFRPRLPYQRDHEQAVTVATIGQGQSPAACGTNRDVWVHDCTYKHHRRRDRCCRTAMSKDESRRSDPW